MANKRDRVILYPRYTTFAGTETFTTQAMNVTAYLSGEITVWLGPTSGTVTITAHFQESSDGVAWSTCSGDANDTLTPTEERLFLPVFLKPWMRLKLVQSDTASGQPVSTLWAYGDLIKRRAP